MWKNKQELKEETRGYLQLYRNKMTIHREINLPKVSHNINYLSTGWDGIRQNKPFTVISYRKEDEKQHFRCKIHGYRLLGYRSISWRASLDELKIYGITGLFQLLSELFVTAWISKLDGGDWGEDEHLGIFKTDTLESDGLNTSVPTKWDCICIFAVPQLNRGNDTLYLPVESVVISWTMRSGLLVVNVIFWAEIPLWVVKSIKSPDNDAWSPLICKLSEVACFSTFRSTGFDSDGCRIGLPVKCATIS